MSMMITTLYANGKAVEKLGNGIKAGKGPHMFSKRPHLDKTRAWNTNAVSPVIK